MTGQQAFRCSDVPRERGIRKACCPFCGVFVKRVKRVNTENKILHTANAGVVLTIGRNAFGADVFSRDPEGFYPDTPDVLREELLDRVQRGELRTLLFTHGHGDHFCLEDVLEALRKNPCLQIISTEEVICRIREREASAGRMYVISPGEQETVRIDTDGFSVELFNSLHMGEQYKKVQNLVCMVQAGGKRIVIPGDARPKPELFERISRWSAQIDWLLAPFPLLGLPTSRRMIERNLTIRHMLALHLPRPEMDTQNWLESAKAVCDRAEDSLPMPIFGGELGREYPL